MFGAFGDPAAAFAVRPAEVWLEVGFGGGEHARALAAAGRTAFTNYLGTTIVMTALFSGWGLGLFAHVPRGVLPLFIVPGWAAMLAWPQWWLARYRHGPFEAVWRRLTWLGTATG